MSIIKARYRERYLKREFAKPAKMLEKYLLTKIINPSIRDFIDGEHFTGNEFKKILDAKVKRYDLQIGFAGYLRKLRKRKTRQYGFSFLERVNYFKLRNKTLIKTPKGKRPKKQKSPHDIEIKDAQVLENFVLSNNKKDFIDKMVEDLAYRDQDIGLKNLNSLNNMPRRLEKKLDAYLDSIKETKLQTLTLNQQKRLLNKRIRGLSRQDAKNYSRFLTENEVRTSMGKAEDLGLETITHAKKFKVWQSFFDWKVRKWHIAMDTKTIESHKLFRVLHPTGIDYIPAPRLGNISPANLFNCRCYLKFQIYPKDKR